MKPDSRLAEKIKQGEFIFTAEFSPMRWTDAAKVETRAGAFSKEITAVNVSDNPDGIALSSLAASIVLNRAGIEPVYQLVTRDRNRIALQSDLLGANLLGIKNVLCLSGYHQTLTSCPESANVFDIDSIQLIAALKRMNDEGLLLDGTKIDGNFSMLAGAAANPFMRPLELNILRLKKKVAAGADFIQTQAVFDVPAFRQWLEEADKEGITKKTAILAGVMPLSSLETAKELINKHTDIIIPDAVLARMEKAGSGEAQLKEGLAICIDIIGQIRSMPGLRGVHIISRGNEAILPQLIDAVKK